MPYVGKMKIHPNHPFAHDQVSVVPDSPANIDLPLGRHGVDVSVSWGYELHSVKIGIKKWKQIRAGEAVMVKSIGWYEGKSFQCRWYFDLAEEESLVVCYGTEGAEGFVGRIRDAIIEERQPRQKLDR